MGTWMAKVLVFQGCCPPPPFIVLLSWRVVIRVSDRLAETQVAGVLRVLPPCGLCITCQVSVKTFTWQRCPGPLQT